MMPELHFLKARSRHSPAHGRRGFGCSCGNLLASSLLGTALVGGACSRSEHPPAIAYSHHLVGPGPARVAQAAIDGWGRPRAVEIRVEWIEQARIRPDVAGELDFAEAMVALPGLVAAVGPLSSRATLLVAPIYAERGIPLISATATTRKLRSVSPWVFPLAPDDEAEGAFIAAFLLNGLRARHVTIFYLVADEYGLGLRDGVVRALRRGGVEPLDEVAISQGSDFPRLVAASLRRGTPQAIVVAARIAEATAILRAVQAALPRVPLVLGDGATLDSAFRSAWRAEEQPVYAVTWWQADEADSSSRAFVARYLQLTGIRPSAFNAMQYDALMVAAQAVREVGPHPPAIRRYLSELGTTRPPYRGVTGPIAFNAGRRTNLVMTRVADGVSVPVDRP